MRSSWKWILLPYALIKCLLGLAVEFLGKCIAGTVGNITSFLIRGLIPILGKFGSILVKWPLVLTQAGIKWLVKKYPGWLEYALDRPASVIGMMCGAMIVTIFIGLTLETELLPEVHQSEITFEMNLPVGTPLEETVRVLSNVESSLMKEQSEIKSVLTTFGYDIANIKRSDEGEHSARFMNLAECSPSSDRLMFAISYPKVVNTDLISLCSFIRLDSTFERTRTVSSSGVPTGRFISNVISL